MSASLLSTLENYGRYNRMANELLYEYCSTIPEDVLNKERPNTKHSIFGILNYAMVVDRDWMNRFRGDNIENVARDEILYSDFKTLKHARAEEDERIEDFVQNITIVFLSAQFQYKDSEGQFRRDASDHLVLHMFNHQTYHRGRVAQILSEMDEGAPVLDYHILLNGRRRD
ncbi:MAG: damage-inducible protein DinB [Rhodospirillales bacterium]|nr:damage-inducible protein DinB [Rhodospirillales bacterium]MBT4007002.1 damage-inducible protein DinB [Rhodospirillales bacterium]MBT5075631.1 damage-inducible protein DinB [Rhodospirillales bacterium]MBT5112862.1 damage-inducible protein DinB [Rhodospirillales bacterium]MBT5673633.1 damage-inducible protein DinB [Rhodospirillales bacterium]